MLPVISILLAIMLPAFAIWKNRSAAPLKRPYLFSLASFISCSCGMMAELFTIKRRLFAGDIGGIEDTIDAVIILCIALLVLTAALNLFLLGLSYEKD